MTWDAYDARTLREMDDVLETIEDYLKAQYDMMLLFSTHGPFLRSEGPLKSVLNGITDSLADVRTARRDIKDTIQQSPARQERPVEPIRL